MKEELERLAACPFCGGEASFEQVENDDSPRYLRWSVGCRDEDCIGFQSMTTFPRKTDAVAAWNRRARCSQEAPSGGDGWVMVPKVAPTDPRIAACQELLANLRAYRATSPIGPLHSAGMQDATNKIAMQLEESLRMER